MLRPYFTSCTVPSLRPMRVGWLALLVSRRRRRGPVRGHRGHVPMTGHGGRGARRRCGGVGVAWHVDDVPTAVRRPVRGTLRVQRDHGLASVGRVLVGNLRRLGRQQAGQRAYGCEPEQLANHGVLLYLVKSATGSSDPPAHSRDSSTARARLRVISPSQLATDVLAVSTKRAALIQT